MKGGGGVIALTHLTHLTPPKTQHKKGYENPRINEGVGSAKNRGSQGRIQEFWLRYDVYFYLVV